jgi:hypothetical protein
MHYREQHKILFCNTSAIAAAGAKASGIAKLLVLGLTEEAQALTK